ncbi:MAG: hypothetical protein SFU20_11735 [Chitinophagaceae bacterium]|nr:hypothetical protein [Chitinophagaceae bacterium]MBN8668857.1 hypothetical protein [Chitinophagales bacterium]MDX1956195.1 hypothetical protein [Chitinophagaceae bacterium]
MKQTKKNINKKTSNVHTRVKKSLDKYAGQVLFPEKLAKANELLKGKKIPT